MKRPILTLSFCLLASASYSDEWGDWDDLPDNLLSPSNSSSSAIDQLYDRLSSDQLTADEDPIETISAWLEDLDLDFSHNNELEALLNELEGESQADITEELEDWLEEQAEDDLDDLLEDSDEFDDEDDDDDEDELDDLIDEEEDELDDEEEEEEESES